jgi:zinc protease
VSTETQSQSQKRNVAYLRPTGSVKQTGSRALPYHPSVTAIDLPFRKQTLENGLDVIVHEDHHVPIVAVNVWYHVGSKNERPGRTGFAHLFEHLMFEGSEHHNSGYFPPLQQAGALLNGSTNTDRTNYWEVVPTSAVDRALWMESDRMGYLLPALTRERFETQRDVVLNERRQNYENRPYGLALMAISAALYPSEHPYHWMTIGAAEDIRAMQLEDVQEFFRTYYHPTNASLVLAGDIEADRAFDLARHYFGEISPGTRPAPVAATAELTREHRLVLEDRVELPRIYIAWHSPAMFAPDDAEMDLLADLLANGKTSRLYRRLVYELRNAVDVSAFQSSREAGGFFLAAVTAAPGHSLTDLATLIDKELQAVVDNGPTAAEMERGVAQAEAHFLYRLQTVGGFGGKSDQLNAYNVLRGDPGYFAADLERYRAATAASVRDAARRYLRLDRRVVLAIVPRGQQALALPGSEPVAVS